MQNLYDTFVAMNANRFFDAVQHHTETFLTYRKKRHLRLKEKSRKKGQIREWIEALLWAVVVVFLINQFIFQLYEIPTPSMEDTLLVRDRVFVNKFIYGPEVYPGGPKILSFNDPRRNDIIVFENPDYISRGPLFDITTRIVYMLTLSLVNLDKDENGDPRSQLYVKRAIGYPGDIIKFEKGDVLIAPPGFANYIGEAQFRSLAGYDFPMKRQITAADYLRFQLEAYASIYDSVGAELPMRFYEAAADSYANPSRLTDRLYYYFQQYAAARKVDPSNSAVRSTWYRYNNGYYVPEDHMLPFGDNRDNSLDGRYFGPVAFEDILGKTIFKFWPLNRIGIAR